MSILDELAHTQDLIDACAEIKVCTRCGADLLPVDSTPETGVPVRVWVCPNEPHPKYVTEHVEDPDGKIEVWIVGRADRLGHVDVTQPLVSFSDPQIAEQECERRNMEEP